MAIMSADDDYDEEIPDEEKLAIATHFLLSSPAGEVLDVLEGTSLPLSVAGSLPQARAARARPSWVVRAGSGASRAPVGGDMHALAALLRLWPLRDPRTQRPLQILTARSVLATQTSRRRFQPTCSPTTCWRAFSVSTTRNSFMS